MALWHEGVHQATIYRYRARLAEIDEATAIAGRTRGWKPLASRLSDKQEHGIEEAVNAFRKKPGRCASSIWSRKLPRDVGCCSCPALRAQPSIDA